jgi:hypothetical protein
MLSSTCMMSARDGLNRKWLADILYTIERAKLEKVIKDAVKARKE